MFTGAHCEARSTGGNIGRSLLQQSALCGSQGYIIGQSYCVTIGKCVDYRRIITCKIQPQHACDHIPAFGRDIDLHLPVTHFGSSMLFCFILCRIMPLPFR